MKNFFTLFLSFSLATAFAQNVGIGTSSPNASAKLDISASNAGVLFPNVTLTGVSDAITIATPAKGLVVWNTGSSWGSAAFYYNDGTSGAPSWTKVATGAVLSNTLTNGKILIGNVSNIATEQTMSGDVTITNAGVTTIGNDKVTTVKILDANVTTAKIANNAVDGTKIQIGSNTNGSLMYYDGNDWVNLAPGTSGQVLRTNGAGAPTWVDPGSTLTAGSGISIATNTITNTGVRTASNGLNVASNDVKLGGALTGATTVSALTATNKMSFTGTGVDAFNVDGTTFSIDATNDRVGIGTAAPGAKLSISTTGTALSGTAASATFTTLAGALGTSINNELSLANIGFTSSNQSSLGIRAYRTAAGTDWTTSAILLEMDVDATPRAGGAYVALNGNGNVGIGTVTPTYALHVVKNADGAGVAAFDNSTAGGFAGMYFLQGGSTNYRGHIGHVNTGGASSFGGKGTLQIASGNRPLVFSATNGSELFNEVARFDNATGNMGIGSTGPAVRLAINGNGSNVYNTDLWIENNAHIQGNETLTQGGKGRLRIGSAWSYVGLYAESSSTSVSNDLVLGASSGLVRIGPNAGSQNLKVSGLEGTGNRPVYATSAGVLTASSVPTYTISSNLHASNDDITGWTNVRTACADDAVGTVNWGFNFQIDGTNYTTGWISTNGVFGFGSSSSTSYSNVSLPTSISSDPMLFFHWDDDGSNLQRYVVLGSSPNRVCHIHSRQSENTGCSGGAAQVDVYIQLHESSNLMSVRYVGIGSNADTQGAGATYGFQFAGGSSAKAIPLGYNSKLLDDNNGNQSFSIDFGQK